MSFQRKSKKASVSPLKVSNLRGSNRSSSPVRKSVSFNKNEVEEFNAYDSINRGSFRSKTSRPSDSPQRLSASFAREQTPSLGEDSADFEEDFVGSIPVEGVKPGIRTSFFSATKDKTRATTMGFLTPLKTSSSSNQKPRYI